MKTRKIITTLVASIAFTLTAFAQSVPSYVPANGLVGYWPFNGNANDESGNGNNGTVNGATLTTDRFGINDKAYNFNGINNFIEGISTNLPLGNSARSVSAWVYMPGLNNNNINFITSWGYGDSDQSSANKAFGVMIGAGLTVMGIWPSFTSSQNENNIIYNTNFSKNDYYHIVVTIDGLGFFKFHINSTLVYSSNITDMSTTANGGVFRIGRSTHTNTDGWAGYFYGKIDDVAIYNRALTQEEITQLYTATPAPTASAQTLCASATVASLTATGTDLKWYATQIDGTVLAPSDALVTQTYYVSQTLGGTESSRTAVAVTVTPATSGISVTNGFLLPTITIGTQIWTTKNLDVSTYSDGTVIPQVQDATAWANLTTGAWCYYNNDPANGATYGKLYNWYAVAGIYNEASKTDLTLRKKIAPTGYHVPSDSEWSTLTDSSMTSIFTGVSGGHRNYLGPFYDINITGVWWSSMEYNNQLGWVRIVNYNSSGVGWQTITKLNGFSVRCLRD